MLVQWHSLEDLLGPQAPCSSLILFHLRLLDIVRLDLLYNKLWSRKICGQDDWAQTFISSCIDLRHGAQRPGSASSVSPSALYVESFWVQNCHSLRLIVLKVRYIPKTCSCCLTIFVHGRNDENFGWKFIMIFDWERKTCFGPIRSLFT